MMSKIMGAQKASFRTVLGKFLPSLENGQNGQNGQKWTNMVKKAKFIVQYKSLLMSSSIRLLGGDSMSLTLPSIIKCLPLAC